MSIPLFSPRDFSKAAGDYAAYRKGFPDSFFKRMSEDGIGRPGQKILDLGTGTGTLARGFARLGADATGLDISPELTEQAQRIGQDEGVTVRYLISRAESIPLESASFDCITAGQCWHWFDGPAVARECLRLLKPGGRLLICHFCYLVEPGNVSERTEEIILRYNPNWPFAGQDGRYEKWREYLDPAGFKDIRAWDYVEDIPYTREEWRGRMRACNGVLALRDPEKLARVDREIGEMLAQEFPNEPMLIPHRVFVIQGAK